MFVACSDDQQKTVQTSTGEFPDQESWNATVLITKEGKTVGVLKAGHVQKFSKKNITLLDENIISFAFTITISEFFGNWKSW